MSSPILKDRSGTEIRVIAPSYGWEPGYEERDELAKKRLESLGYDVTFGDHLKSHQHLGTASAKDRVEDYHEALRDQNVNAIMAYSGGWSLNEILPLIDWDIVKTNPKPFVGFSDVTAALNAIYAKTGQIGIQGPNFGTLGREAEWQYTLSNLQNVLAQCYPMELKPSHHWTDKEMESIHANDDVSNAGDGMRITEWRVLQQGEGEGILLVGNVFTFFLLQGTEYQPQFDKPFIFMAEIDGDAGDISAQNFSRVVESILQQPGARQYMRGMLIGRMQERAEFSLEDMARLIELKQLGPIPVICDMDFGHTLPIMSLPVGGKAKISADHGGVSLTLV